MREQHLSDEAVAAFADGVLTGHARERARRHCADCADCGQAVVAQREAVFLLRAAPAPSLPTGLFDRLVQVPITTPIKTLPTALAEDGTTMFATFGSMATAAFVPTSTPSRSRHLRPLVVTTAAVAAAGVLTVSSAATAGGARYPANSRTVGTSQARVDGNLSDVSDYLPYPQPARVH